MASKKFDLETKINAVMAYERNEGSWATIAAQINASKYTVRDWWHIYQSIGVDGLCHDSRHNKWNEDIKLMAVKDYLSGTYSLYDVCKKYKIYSKSLLNRWIEVYNSHINSDSREKRQKFMTKGRKVTLEEKNEIVLFCIANSKDYYAAMDKYKVSYQQIYSWVKKYETKGLDGLIDRRGKAKPENELTELDKLRIENRKLAAKNAELELENRIIKKLQEVERRRY